MKKENEKKKKILGIHERNVYSHHPRYKFQENEDEGID